MKKICFLLALLLCVAAIAACSPEETGPSAGPEQAATPTPEPTPLPTSTPYIPVVDPSLPHIETLRETPVSQLPARVRLEYIHGAGLPVESLGELALGEGYALYLLRELGDPALPGFVLDQDRVRPDRSPLRDTGEGLTVQRYEGTPQAALEEAIGQWEEEGFVASTQEDIFHWNGSYTFGEFPQRGAVPYEGTYAVLEGEEPTVIRLFALASDSGTFIVTMRVYEPVDQPPMFHYLCCMLASLRLGHQ